MSIHSPDRVIVEAVDRLLAHPQKSGLPLPALLQRLDAAFPALHLASTVGIACSGLPGAIPFALAYGLTMGTWVLASTHRSFRSLGADARSWGPDLATRYRSLALARRETRGGDRAMFLAALFVVLVAVANALNGAAGGLPGLSIPLGFLPLMSALVLREYAHCAMPRDPDLFQAVHGHA